MSLPLPILHLKKYIKKVLLFSPQIGEDSRVSSRAKELYSTEYRFASQKIIGLVLMLFKLTQCDKQKSAIIIVASGSSLKMGAGTETNELDKGRVFLSTKSNQIF